MCSTQKKKKDTTEGIQYHVNMSEFILQKSQKTIQGWITEYQTAIPLLWGSFMSLCEALTSKMQEKLNDNNIIV